MASSKVKIAPRLEGSNGALASLVPGVIVFAANHLACVQSPGGDLTPVEQLGPGIVREPENEGEVKVYWAEAEFESWVAPDDLSLAGAGAHLITVRKCDGHGRSTLLRNRVVSKAGLCYNWLVEIGAGQVLRAIRSDGYVWTFNWYPVFNQAHPLNTLLTAGYQMTDEEAEALTAAELAMEQPQAKRSLLRSLRWRVFASY